ncbi:MAG: DUF4233 domain-containing protein [Angustibacter sp.]
MIEDSESAGERPARYPDRQGRPSRSLRRSFAALVLSGELLVIGFAALVAKDLAEVPDRSLAFITAALAGLCVAAIGSLRSPVGFVLGWLVQGALLLSSIWVPAMLALGLLFGALWLAGLRLGARADAARAAAGADPSAD